jgi:hypothetical protein
VVEYDRKSVVVEKEVLVARHLSIAGRWALGIAERLAMSAWIVAGRGKLSFNAPSRRFKKPYAPCVSNMGGSLVAVLPPRAIEPAWD